MDFFFFLQMRELDVFRVAQCVKVNPDSPQKQVRFLTLSGQILHLEFVCVVLHRAVEGYL